MSSKTRPSVDDSTIVRPVAIAAPAMRSIKHRSVFIPFSFRSELVRIVRMDIELQVHRLNVRIHFLVPYVKGMVS